MRMIHTEAQHESTIDPAASTRATTAGTFNDETALQHSNTDSPETHRLHGVATKW